MRLSLLSKNILTLIIILAYILIICKQYSLFPQKNTYPSKPITIVVHSGAGSSVDLMAREIAEIASAYCPVPWVIENHTGSQGLKAMKQLDDAKADGYTLLAVTKSFLSTIALNKQKIHNDNITYLANMMLDPEALISHKESSINTISDLIRLSREKEEGLSWMGPGTGSRDHLMAIKTMETLNIKGKWMDYKSSPQSILALLRNEAPVYVGNPADIKGKDKLKILAIAAKNRLAKHPEVPTFQEEAYQLFEYMWRGFAIKAKCPESTKTYLSNILFQVSNDIRWKNYCEQNEVFPDYQDEKSFNKMVSQEMEETRHYLHEANLLTSYNNLTNKTSVGLLMVSLLVSIIVFSLLFKKNFLSYELIICSLLVGFSVFFLIEASQYHIPKGINAVSPSLFPVLWASLQLGLCVLLAIQIIRKKIKPNLINSRPGIMVFIASSLYLLLTYLLGYYISTPLFLFYMFRYSGIKKPMSLINYALSFTIIIFLVFPSI